MVRVKATESTMFGGRKFVRGEVYEVPESDAAALGFLVIDRVSPPPPPPAQPVEKAPEKPKVERMVKRAPVKK